MQRCQRSRSILIAILLIMLTMTGAGLVSAANGPPFVASDPPSGATITAPPTQITVTFANPLDSSLTGGYVHDMDGKIVSTSIKVSTDDSRKIIITLGPNLVSGWYMVMWNTAVQGSGDIIFGDTTFDLEPAS